MEQTSRGSLADATVISHMLLLSIIFKRAGEGCAVSRAASWCFPRCSRPRVRQKRPGFTLLELAVVLLIIGLVLAIAMPRFAAFQGAELRSESRRLAARSHYLCEEAGAQKVVLRLNLDLEHSTYFVTRLDPFAVHPSFMPETGPAGGVVTMPSDVRLRDVWVEGAGLFRNGVAGFEFYPSGVADAAVIHLLDRNADVITVGINPVNGTAAIIVGDVSPAEFQENARR